MTIKTTSYQYGASYQNTQLTKHRNRNANHWCQRLELVASLCEQLTTSLGTNSAKSNRRLLDIGCSIGTTAIHLSQLGYNVDAVDFDFEAIELAKDLAKEENVKVNFLCEDVTSFDPSISYDIITCIDIFEHLHDDELGCLLSTLKRLLTPDGIIVFYTFPQKYDYITFSDSLVLQCASSLLNLLPSSLLRRVIPSIHSFFNALSFLFFGISREQKIKHISHCNPTTSDRLLDIFQRLGFTAKIDSTTLSRQSSRYIPLAFPNKKSYHRSLYGVLRVAK